MRLRVAVLAAVMALAGCANGGSSIPSTTSGAQAQKTVRASITVRIPAKTPSSKSPAYISSATQSIAGTISPASGCGGCSSTLTIATNLTPSSSGCATSGGATTCTIALSLNPGSYTATLSTYSGPLSGGTPSGYELSTNQAVPETVSANAANTLALTLSGVPNSVTLTGSNGTNSSYINSTTGPILLDGVSSALTLTVNGVDSAGETIVGPGSPAMTFGISGGNGFSATQTGPNTVVVTAPAKGTTGADTLNIAMSTGSTGACSAPQAECAQPISVQFLPRLAVAEDNGASSSIWTSPVSPIGTRVDQATVTSGLSNPRYLAFDSKGDLFVGDQSLNEVLEYPYPITSNTPIHTIAAGGSLSSMTIDGNDNLIVGTPSSVTEYDAPSYTTPHSIGPITGTSYIALAASATTLYVVAGGAAGTAAVTPFTGSHFATAGTSFTAGLNFPQDAALDPSGNLWVANFGTGTNGTVTEYGSGALTRTLSTGGTPVTLSIDAEGNVAVDAEHVSGTQTSFAYFAPSYGAPVTMQLLTSPAWLSANQLVATGNNGGDVDWCSALTPTVVCTDLLVGRTSGGTFNYPPVAWP